VAPTTPSTFSFIDLFAGIGGFRFALEGLGGDCVLTVERDPFARMTYAAWHGEELDSPTFVGVIEDLDVADVPAHDVLAAGFPCQPFSLAGVSKKNSLGRAHGFADPTQGTLFFNIKEIAAERRPSILILENEGNARLVTSQPRIHEAVMGLERVVADWDEAAHILQVLPMAAIGQDAANYVNLITGPRREGE
jgi:DNA-cytosine methyltransferase